MPITPGLEKYFDSRKSKRKKLKRKLKDISKHIDPAFMDSFEIFRCKLLGIVVKNPDCENLITQELEETEEKIIESNSRYNIKLGASLVDAVK